MVAMASADLALVALVTATALHAGFQLTVTSVVYPALARVPVEQFEAAHEAHGRSIVPIVALSYSMLLAACLWAMLAASSSVWVWVAAGGALTAVLVTALVAAPTHGALAQGRRPELVHRLLVADRVRSAGAAVALVAAVAAAVATAVCGGE